MFTSIKEAIVALLSLITSVCTKTDTIVNHTLNVGVAASADWDNAAQSASKTAADQLKINERKSTLKLKKQTLSLDQDYASFEAELLSLSAPTV
jgi:hypothetical protein